MSRIPEEIASEIEALPKPETPDELEAHGQQKAQLHKELHQAIRARRALQPRPGMSWDTKSNGWVQGKLD